MEQAFINTVIAFKKMEYFYSLKCFFKQEFKKNGGYVIPFSHILHIKKNIFLLIRDSCGYVCPYNEQCDGHKFMDFIDKLCEFQHHAVLEQKWFFQDFYVYNFRFTDKVRKIAGWDFKANVVRDLSNFSYSQRLHYLN